MISTSIWLMQSSVASVGIYCKRNIFAVNRRMLLASRGLMVTHNHLADPNASISAIKDYTFKKH